MGARLSACVTLLVLAVAPRAVGSPFPQANEYFKIRDRAAVVQTFSQEEIQTQPQKFAGKLIEVRGVISAVAGSEAQTTLLLSGPGDRPPVAVVLPPGKALDHWPFLDVGTAIRALCQVVLIAGTSTGQLELFIPVKEYEAAAVDQERARAAEARAREEQVRRAAEQRARAGSRPLASRGVGSAAFRQAPVRPRYTYQQLVEIYASAVRYFNRRISMAQAKRIAATILEYSLRYDLDPRLVMAVIAVESNFNPGAVSPKGAMGLGQLMPGTASGLGVANAFDVRQNLEGSTRLLKNHIQNMSADGTPTEEAIKLALACYNAGAGAVRKYGGIPPYRETRNYVAKITRLYRQLCGLE